jgi:hypothetical protein
VRTVRTDFNERSGEHVLVLREDYPEKDVFPGTGVLLKDEDGNACEGAIHHSKGGLLYVLPRWNTWQDGAA